MRKRNAIRIILAALLLMAPAGCAALTGGGEDNAAPEAVEAVVIEANREAEEPEPALYLASDAAHPALMTCGSDGKFHPDRLVTKAELCSLLYPLLDGLESGGEAAFSDVEPGGEAYEAIMAMQGAGLLPEEDREAFGPDLCITRQYLADVLYAVADALGGEEARRVRLAAIDADAGVTAPEGAVISDTAKVKRSEMAVILERIEDRVPDEMNLFMNGCVPGDVNADDSAWQYIADAVTEGLVRPVSGGVHRLYGWLYAAWDDGTMIMDMDYGVWTFGSDGRYTTGSEALDGYLAEALEASGANELEGEEALKAAYLYIKYDFEYLVTPEDLNTIPVGETGWEYERAERFFRNGGGTCYGYAAAFGLMARALGYHAYAVAAEVNQYYGAHGFVVIPEGEEDVIYDVEMESTRPERHADFDLFAIRNYEIYNYWYVANWRI